MNQVQVLLRISKRLTTVSEHTRLLPAMYCWNSATKYFQVGKLSFSALEIVLACVTFAVPIIVKNILGRACGRDPKIVLERSISVYIVWWYINMAFIWSKINMNEMLYNKVFILKRHRASYKIDMTRLNNFISLRKRSIDCGGKIVDNVDFMNISILITKRAQQFIVFKLEDVKDPRKVTRHRGW